MLTQWDGGPVEGGDYPAEIWHTFMVDALGILSQEAAAKNGGKATTTTTTTVAPSTVSPSGPASECPGRPDHGRPDHAEDHDADRPGGHRGDTRGPVHTGYDPRACSDRSDPGDGRDRRRHLGRCRDRQLTVGSRRAGSRERRHPEQTLTRWSERTDL